MAFQPGQPVPGVELDGTLACFVPVEHTRSSTDVEDVAAIVAAVPEGGRSPSRAPATEGVEAPPRLSPQGGICAGQGAAVALGAGEEAAQIAHRQEVRPDARAGAQPRRREVGREVHAPRIDQVGPGGSDKPLVGDQEVPGRVPGRGGDGGGPAARQPPSLQELVQPRLQSRVLGGREDLDDDAPPLGPDGKDAASPRMMLEKLDTGRFGDAGGGQHAHDSLRLEGLQRGYRRIDGK